MATTGHRGRRAATALTATLLGTATLAQSLPPPPVSPAPMVNYEYDAQGNRTRSVQAPGSLDLATRNTYDALSRLKDSTDAKAGRTQFAYDGLDRTLQITDPRNLVTQYPRNGLGDATQLISPDTGTATHTYDAAGNLKTRTDSRGVKATHTWDALHRLTQTVYSKSGQTSVTHGWTYDQTGTGFAYGIGRLTSTARPAGSTRYGYDAQGRLFTAGAHHSRAAPTLAQVPRRSATATTAGRMTSIIYPSGQC